MTTNIIEITDCSLSLGDKKIIDKVSWHIEASTFNCIVGPNGAGKTTLMKALTGELSLDHGEVSIEQKSLKNFSAREAARRRAVVSQFHDTNFPFLCSEIVDMGLDALSAEDLLHAEQHKQVAVQTMQVAHLLTRRFDRLSGGEQQRIICARALTQLGVSRPSLSGKILFLDEPTSNMDIRHQISLFNQLKALCDIGLTVVAILHDLDCVYQFADEVLLLANGKMIGLGRPFDVLATSEVQATFGVNSTVVTLPNGKKRLLVNG